MSRDRMPGEDPYIPCMGYHDDGDYIFAQVWWYADIFDDGRVGLCDDCARGLARGLLCDALQGRTFTLGDFIDEVILSLMRGGQHRATNVNPLIPGGRRATTP